MTSQIMDETKAKEIIEQAKADTRTPDEIFESISNRLKRDFDITDDQATEGTRNLLGYFESLFEMTENKEKREKQKET